MNTTVLQAGFRVLGWLAAGCMLATVARADDDARKIGDKCSTAFQLNGPLPLSVSGTTVGFSNDYDAACPYGDSTAPDVVYRYTPGSTVTADILLCTGITDFDTKLYVYESLCPPDGGGPIACNDDACVSDTGQGFVSALWNIPLQAGTTYYIVVDGYGSAAGNYTLTLRASLPEPTCPADGTTAFAQRPGLENWTLAFSDYGDTWWVGPSRYENFCDVTSQITGIRFWGLGFRYQRFPPPGTFTPPYWEPCIENPMTFDIRFYADAGGVPGEEVSAYNVSLPGTLVGHVGYAQYELYEYAAQFDAPLALPQGWVSIVGAGPPDCWFAWMSSAEGDGRSFSVTDDPHHPETAEHLDLALCLATNSVPIDGACCDDLPGTCSDNVLAADCAGRFLAGGSCGDLTPPCGAVTGACYTGTECRISTQHDCQRTCPGDLNCDRAVNLADVNPFVLALTNPAGYASEFPDCALINADCNGDGTLGLEDINPFISLVGSVCTTWDSWAGPDRPCMPWCDVSNPWCIIYSSDLPYTSTRTTCDRENYFDQTCLGPYDGGQDTLYALVVTDPVELEIIVDPKSTDYTSLLLSDHFPPDQDCLAASSSAIAAPYSLGCQHLEPGTYFVMIDSSPSPECIYMYDLTISACTLELGRCCYDNGAQCADTTKDECAGLGGVWDGTQDCTVPCPSRFREDCANAESISSVPFDVVFYTDAMTADGPAAPCDKYGPTGAMQNDAWLAWTADVSGLAVALALGDYDAVLVVRTDCTNSLYCADNAGPGSEEILRFNVTAGTTYYFQIGTAGNHTGGGWTSFSLQVPTNVGACCIPGGACLLMEGTTCIYQGGNYQGNGTVCASDTCPAEPGADCASPLVITLTADSLPFVDYNYTTGRGNDYTSTCLGSYDSGEDIIYELAVMETVVVNITLDPAGASYTGFALADHCPPTDCIAKSINTTGTPYSLKYVVLRPGLYYLMVDNWLTPSDIPTYTLTIENADTDLGACCTISGCIGNMQLAQCLDAQGAWHRGEPCNGATCQTEDGDSCLDPLVIALSPYPWYQGGDDTYYRGNSYAGTTCLGLYDGGKEVIYQLVVSDADVCVNVRLDNYYAYTDAHMVLSTTCPPESPCLAVGEYWYGVQAIRELVLTPGVYYLMVDVWPQEPWPGQWEDRAEFTLWIEPCADW